MDDQKPTATAEALPVGLELLFRLAEIVVAWNCIWIGTWMRSISKTRALGMALAMGALGAACFASLTSASAHGLQVLYRFCADLPRCADGRAPAGLLADQAGNIYGFTTGGGTHKGAAGGGVAFEMTPNEKGKYTYNVLYRFCPQDNCANGKNPYGAPIIDTSGNLYGTTANGGAYGNGTVFELIANNGSWTAKALYSFCPQQGCADGEQPHTGLTYAGAASGTPYDGTSPLYGTTETGGAGGGGVAYSVKPGQNGWMQSVLYSFSSPNTPDAALFVDVSGNLFGSLLNGGNTTFAGGLFELSNTGNGWNETALYNFCSNMKKGSQDCTTGAVPDGGMVMDSSGRLWGTTALGGYNCKYAGGFGCGTVFVLTPDGANYDETVAYEFCKKTPSCADDTPQSSTLDSQGNLYGVASGGDGNEGVLFELQGSTQTLLYQFCQMPSCTDGAIPAGAPVFGATGSLFGTTAQGGNDNNGTLYEFTP